MAAWAVLELVFEQEPTNAQLRAFNKWLREADPQAPKLTKAGWLPSSTRWREPAMVFRQHPDCVLGSESIEKVLAEKLSELGIHCRLRVLRGYAGTDTYAALIRRCPWTHSPPLPDVVETLRTLAKSPIGPSPEYRREVLRLADAIERNKGLVRPEE